MIKTILVTAGILLAFLVPASVFTADQLREWLSYGLIVACVIGIARWLPAAWEVFTQRAGERSSLGIIGVVVLLAAIAANQIYAVSFLKLDRPTWLRETQTLNTIVYVMLIGAVLFVTVTRFDGEKPTRTSRLFTAAIAFIGLLFTSIGTKLVALLTHALSMLFPG